MQTTIALCVPAYNAAAHLPRLFESVRRQTVPFDEVWVYDDASTDDTAAVAAQLGARVVRGQVNHGCPAGKNALLAQVDTAWVHFHDADDALAPEFVARAKARIANEEFDVLIFDYEQVDESTDAQMSRSDFVTTDLLSDPVRYMLANTVNNGGVYSVALLRQTGGFDLDPGVLYNEDRAFHLRLAEAGARFVIEPYVGSRFYFNRGSMSAANRARCCLASHEITLRFANRHPDRYRDEVAHLAWQNAACLASCLEWRGADACVALACAMGSRVPEAAGTLFKLLCFVNPYWAIRIREALIRLLKPRYRASYPVCRKKPEFSRSGGRP
jgi:glycosyltransferase involved in cell wall biosynthesis